MDINYMLQEFALSTILRDTIVMLKNLNTLGGLLFIFFFYATIYTMIG